MDKLKAIAERFAVDGEVAQVRPLGQGFINDTYFVIMAGEGEPRYILQRKNHLVFPDVPAMMDNIDRVTRHIKSRVEDPLRQTLTVIPTRDGRLCLQDEAGNWWAMCLFIRGSRSYDAATTPELAAQGGYGLGEFHRLVSDLDEPLAEVIKGFHNMRYRLEQWDASLARDAAGRVSSLGEEISWIESRRKEIMDFWKLVEDGTVPSRVTHNDTKISNFLFDASDGHLLCAIDLDTVMRSTLLNDVGDALRSYTNTGAEDDRDLSRVSMSRAMYDAYMNAYLDVTGPYLTDIELKYLPFSGRLITFEQVLRFLMDYIDGDTYYRIAYPEHNLVRTRAQYRLLQSMEDQL